MLAGAERGRAGFQGRVRPDLQGRALLSCPRSARGRRRRRAVPRCAGAARAADWTGLMPDTFSDSPPDTLCTCGHGLGRAGLHL